MKLDRLLPIHQIQLDTGFTILAAKVLRQYIDVLIPAAIAQAKDRNSGRKKPVLRWRCHGRSLHLRFATLKPFFAET